MIGLRTSFFCLLGLGSALGAQSPTGRSNPDEFFALQSVVQQAMDRAAPWIVTVETFGGSRRILAGGGPQDGMAQPGRPRPAPKPRDDEEKPKLSLKRPPGFLQGQGGTSGIILSSDGWILVSRFALNYDPTTVVVTLPDGTAYNAERGGEDTSRGIALLKVEAEGLPCAEFVHPDEVRVGQWAFALGRTFARKGDPTVHMGIISARDRQFGRALQVDAYTSPVNYGGPIVDVQGRVLGISVPLSPAGRDAGVEWYDSGIGFAATIGDIPDLIERMKEGDTLHRGWLGIQTNPSDMGPGALIMSVPRGGSAHSAGLRKSDKILEVDGVPVKNPFHLQMLVSSRIGGDAVHLKVEKRRNKGTETMTVFLQDTPYEERAAGVGDEMPSAFPWDKEKR